MPPMFDTDEVDRTLRSVLSDVLGIDRARVLTELEERLGIVIDDDEVDGELFERFGNLLTFARAKSLA